MTGQRPTLLVFCGGMGGSRIENVVASARCAATFDTIETAQSAGIRSAIVVTDDPELHTELPEVEIVVDDGAHHFGRKLNRTLADYSLRSVIYLGGGSVPFLRVEDFVAVVEALEAGKAVTNNRFSSDLVAWGVGERTADAVVGLDRDNSLARAVQESGTELVELPRTVETVFDIDTPTDLAILSVTGFGGERLRTVVREIDLDLDAYRRVLPLFVDRNAQITVAGRVGSHSWQYLERETACRVRVFAEERGMEADGRAASGEARSMIGYFLASAGYARFFDVLSELGDAALIDTRVLLAHECRDARRADRFLSDARRWSEIEDEYLRDLTMAANDASIPVLLGGHSLVSGGLMALNEFAWQQSEAGLLPDR
ncbi:MAG: hypothetical protein IH957_07050 [Chloroflexi bacterium]|nr:hypothetical protein [Chloroflexota bacterium]